MTTALKQAGKVVAAMAQAGTGVVDVQAGEMAVVSHTLVK